MDVVTQGLLGAVVAAIGYRHRLGPRALLYGAACGVAPDLDALTLAGGYWLSLENHRGCAHSLVILGLLAAPLGSAASRWLGEGRDRRAWVGLTFWALITHPILDLFTSFGTQLLAPLSRARFALDGVGAIDPLVTLPLAFALGLGVKYGAAIQRRAATLAVTWSALYLLGGAGLSLAARLDLREALAARGSITAKDRALIAPALPLLRRVVARDDAGGLVVALWSPWAGLSPVTTLALPAEPEVARALTSPRGQVFRWFADDYVSAELTRDPDGATVRLSDQRFGLVTRPAERSMFQVEFRFTPDMELRSITPAPLPSIAIAEELAAGWRRSVGGRPQVLPPPQPEEQCDVE